MYRASSTKRAQPVGVRYGQKDVREYLYTCIATIIEKASIVYIKWDMNRYLTEVFSSELSNSRQGETSHRFMMGTYDLLNRIVKKFQTCY